MSTPPMCRGTARLPRLCLVLAVLTLLAVGCGGGNKSGGSNDNGPLGGGPTRSGCAPKLSFVSPNGDGTLFIQGPMPATDSNGNALHYQWRRAAAGITGLSPWMDFTPTRNSPSDPTSGTANLTATVNGLQQPLPWKSGDTIQIRNECGTDSQSVI